MPFPPSAAAAAQQAARLRRIAAFAVALVALLLWLAFLPALLGRDTLTPHGDGCWFRGYRDPVTGRGRPFAGDEMRLAEACLATPRKDRS